MLTIVEKIATFFSQVPIIGDWLNNFFINRYARIIPARPRPLSMSADYTNWPGVTDRRISGRHLPPNPEHIAQLPDLNAVVELFQQHSDQRATDTSLLFPFFAQWFTDSFLRTQWKPEEKQDFVHNESNHEIDLCQIYGMDEDKTAMLRSGADGLLKSQVLHGEEYPVYLFEKQQGEVRLKKEFQGLYTEDNLNRVFARATDEHKLNSFAVGLEHGNSTMGNTLLNVLFLREHNRIARSLQNHYPHFSDEQLFQTARNINIVCLLNIVISDYIVHISPVDFPLRVIPGKAEKERWYRTNWISVEFALLYRWHSLIPQSVSFDKQEKPSSALRHNNVWLQDVGVSELFKQASQQRAGKLGLGNTPPFLTHVSETSLKMARKCELQSYNQYRQYYKLSPFTSFEQLTDDQALAEKLKSLYNSIDNVEWFVGIFAEGYGKQKMMGDLMTRMVANDAFTQALTNPLLSKHIYNEKTFTEIGMEIINNTQTLADVVVRNTNVNDKTAISFQY